MWYVAILASLAATFYAYRQRHSIHRLGNDEVGDLGRLLGTDFGVVFCGSIALLFVLLCILLSNPSNTVIKETARSREIADFQLLGEKIAFRVAGSIAERKKMQTGATKNAPWKALIIAHEAGEKGKVYHDTLINAIKKGLEGKVEDVVVELVPRNLQSGDPARNQTALMTLGNRPLDAICAKHRNANAVICLVPVHYNFADSMVAQETAAGQKIFALYTDNVYNLGSAINFGNITFCITHNPLYRPEKVKPEATSEERYSARFLPPIRKNNILTLASEYKIFFTRRRTN